MTLPKQLIKDYLDYREKKLITDSLSCRQNETIIFEQGRLHEIRIIKDELKKKNCFKLTRLQEAVKND